MSGRNTSGQVPRSVGPISPTSVLESAVLAKHGRQATGTF